MTLKITLKRKEECATQDFAAAAPGSTCGKSENVLTFVNNSTLRAGGKNCFAMILHRMNARSNWQLCDEVPSHQRLHTPSLVGLCPFVRIAQR